MALKNPRSYEGSTVSFNKEGFEEARKKRKAERLQRLAKDPQLSVSVTPEFKLELDNIRDRKRVRKNATYLKQALNLLMAIDSHIENDEEIVISNSTGSFVIKGPLKNIVGR